MKLVEPEVYLFSRPSVDITEVERYLQSIGVEDWLEGKIGGPNRDGDLLAEIGGRLCYRSWEPGLNKNVTKIREDSKEYIQNILASGHGSVTEHSNYTFVLANVSRILTHEIVRHRAGVAISQESMRYVRLDDIPMWIPEWAQKSPALMMAIGHFLSESEMLIDMIGTMTDIDNQPFHEKKKITSFMRRFAPAGHATTIMLTINVRALRHIIYMRTALGAEEEIRIVCDKIAEVIKPNIPFLMQDYKPNENREWVPDFLKV